MEFDTGPRAARGVLAAECEIGGSTAAIRATRPARSNSPVRPPGRSRETPCRFRWGRPRSQAAVRTVPAEAAWADRRL